MGIKKNLKNMLLALSGNKIFKNTFPENNSIKKILIFSLYFKGDLLFHTAFIEGIKTLFPSSELDLWIKPGNKDVIENDPRINAIHTFNDIKTAGYRDNSKFNLKGKIAFIKFLKKEKYDLIIDLTGKYSTGLITLLAKPGYSIGINYNYFGFCYDKFIWLNTYGEKGHLIDKYVSVLKYGLNLSEAEYNNIRKNIRTKPYIRIHENIQKTAEDIFREYNIIKSDTLIIIHCTSGWKAKELNANIFAELADYFTSANYQFFFIGDSGDKEKLKEIQSYIKTPGLNLEIKFISVPFMVSAELIRRASLFIGSDSAPLHLAGAVDTPSVGIFGPTNPEFSKPVGEKHKIIYHKLYCSASANMQYCTRNGGFTCATIDCMAGITSSEIINTSEEMLKLYSKDKKYD